MKLQYVALFVGMFVVTANAAGPGKDVKRSEAEK